jgi:hypothetical protein|tara:strand:- start:812 stop:1183 length:372 start_codon:yes stop_codon:yes gene_type:complete
MFLNLLAPILGKVLDRVIPDKAGQQKAMQELNKALVTHSADIEKAAASVVIAEAKGEGWLQRNWRPLTMLSFLGLLFLYWFGVHPENLSDQVVMKLFDLLQIGIGGYIISRGAEKGIKTWKEK